MVNDASDGTYLSSPRSALLSFAKQTTRINAQLPLCKRDTWAAVVQTIGRDDALVSKRG